MGFKLLLYWQEDRPESHVAETWPRLIRERLRDVEVRLVHTRADALRHIADADAAFGMIDPELFATARRLRWVACPQAGPDPSFYHRALVESDVVVTNVRGIYNDHISAHIMAFVLAFARGLPVYWARQREHTWQKGAHTVYLPEATALIVGVGGIGAATARLCAAFGITVIGLDPRVTEPPEGVSELYGPAALYEQLPRADFVIVTVPETPHTQGLFDARVFEAMQPTAAFINIGRGRTVKLDDLDAALRAHRIGGAALDVFETEPLPADHPLWDAPHMLITPHVATDQKYLNERRTELFLDNCVRFHEGRPLRNVVDKTLWF